MRLQELREHAPLLTDEMDINIWLSKNLGQVGPYKIHPNGIVDVTGNVALSPLCSVIKVQFGVVTGDFTTQVTDAIPPNLTSLIGAPQQAVSIDISGSTRIKTLEGIGACDEIIAYDTGIARIEDVFPHLSKEKGVNKLDICGTNITSLVGVGEIATTSIRRLGMSFQNIEDGGIGLLLIHGLEEIGCDAADDDFNEGMPEAFKIIRKYIGRPEDIFECQNELIEAGLERYAVL